ncbi:MAG: lactate utilization protein [Planctomycetota bacterium]|nr:lactate utilization protein [Planctomycetota bacterium]
MQGVGGEACRAGSLEDARKALGELRMRWDAQGVVYSLDPLVQELGVPEWLKGEGVPGQVLDGGEGERVWRAELAAAAAAQREPNVPWHMAVIGCAGAIAETGSIAHLTAPGHGRGGWLLCRAQVVLLTAEQIVSDLDGLFVGGGALDRNALPRAVTLVTGPSRTADIEQTLTIGVHGPGKFAAVVMG